MYASARSFKWSREVLEFGHDIDGVASARSREWEVGTVVIGYGEDGALEVRLHYETGQGVVGDVGFLKILVLCARTCTFVLSLFFSGLESSVAASVCSSICSGGCMYILIHACLARVWLDDMISRLTVYSTSSASSLPLYR